jgi:hypothetical protein
MAASGQRPQTILSRHQEHGPDVSFRQTPPYRFLLAPSSRSKLFPIFMAAAGSMPNTTHSRHQVGGWTFAPWCPSIAFSSPLTAFLATILRASVLFTAKPSRDHDTQNIHVAHIRLSTESSHIAMTTVLISNDRTHPHPPRMYADLIFTHHLRLIFLSPFPHRRLYTTIPGGI